MPAAGLDDDDQKRLAARLRPDLMPPAAATGVPAPQPEAQTAAAPTMPPARIAQPAPATTPAQAPMSEMPPAPVQAPQSQEPQLHGWRKALDTLGSVFPIGRAIETAIPGTPQNWSMKQAQQAARDREQAEIEGQKQRTASEKSATDIAQQESKMVPVPGHPEMGLVEQKNLSNIEKQLAANQGKEDTANITQAGETKRNEEKISAKTAVPTGLKLGVLKPDILAQVPMPENGTPEEMAAWGKKYDELAAKAGQKQTGLGTYSAIRLLDWATKYEPQLLTSLPQILKGAGFELPQGAVPAGIPEGQPLSPESGRPIGTAMPEAPTSQTRTQAQTAARVITELPRIRQEITANAANLGPVKGRAVVGFMLGKVGSTGDPQLDQSLNQMRTDLTFMTGASGKFHQNAVAATEKFEQDVNAGKDSAAAINGFLDSVTQWATTAQKQERGYEPPANSGPPAPQPGMKVQQRTVNGKTEYRQVPIGRQ